MSAPGSAWSVWSASSACLLCAAALGLGAPASAQEPEEGADDEELIVLDDEEGDPGIPVAEDEAPPPAPEGSADEGEPPADAPAAEEEKTAWATLEEDLTAFLDGNWLDPPGEFWEVRRGARLELAFYVGGEAAAGKIQPSDINIVPNVGAITLSPVGRWYPVDQVALVFGARGYVGIGGQAAAGTKAQTVLTPFFGVRYDLVKEHRLSVMLDVYSGPSAFVFASLADATVTQNLFDRVIPQLALGAEVAGGVSGRYSLGPTTFELRALVGGRAGSAQDVGRASGEVGPFSSLFAGLDLGITWSFWHDGVPAPAAVED